MKLRFKKHNSKLYNEQWPDKLRRLDSEHRRLKIYVTLLAITVLAILVLDVIIAYLIIFS